MRCSHVYRALQQGIRPGQQQSHVQGQDRAIIKPRTPVSTFVSTWLPEPGATDPGAVAGPSRKRIMKSKAPWFSSISTYRGALCTVHSRRDNSINIHGTYTVVHRLVNKQPFSNMCSKEQTAATSKEERLAKKEKKMPKQLWDKTLEVKKGSFFSTNPTHYQVKYTRKIHDSKFQIPEVLYFCMFSATSILSTTIANSNHHYSPLTGGCRTTADTGGTSCSGQPPPCSVAPAGCGEDCWPPREPKQEVQTPGKQSLITLTHHM